MYDKKLLFALKDVALCDKKIVEKKDQLSLKKKYVDQLSQSLQRFFTSHDQEKKEFDLLKKEHQETRLSTQELAEKEQRLRDRLEVLTHPKEYRATEREIELVSKKRRDLESQLNSLTTAYTQKNQEEQKNQLSAQQQKEQYEKETLLCEQEILSLSQEIETLSQERLILLAQLPIEWQNRYEKMRFHVLDPLAPVTEGVCGSCYYTILPQDLNQLKKYALLTCKSCYRILYYNGECEAVLVSI